MSATTVIAGSLLSRFPTLDLIVRANVSPRSSSVGVLPLHAEMEELSNRPAIIRTAAGAPR
jgi:hypothetical protein